AASARLTEANLPAKATFLPLSHSVLIPTLSMLSTLDEFDERWRSQLTVRCPLHTGYPAIQSWLYPDAFYLTGDDGFLSQILPEPSIQFLAEFHTEASAYFPNAS